MLVKIEQPVIYAPDRIGRFLQDSTLPRGAEISPRREHEPSCVFCPGNEPMTPPEIWAYNRHGWPTRPPNTPGGWEVRVIQNKYPLPKEVISNHELLIFTPDHRIRDLFQLSEEQIWKILFGHRERFRAHEAAGRAPLAFINKGRLAGATQEHLHSQLVSFSPEDLPLDRRETPKDELIVTKKDGLVLHCPERSEFVLEMILQPQESKGDFSAISEGELVSLASIFQEAARALETNPCAQKLLCQTWRNNTDGGVPYNTYLKGTSGEGGKSWHIRLMPCLTIPGGLEKATGFAVNIITPHLAAELLRKSLASS